MFGLKIITRPIDIFTIAYIVLVNTRMRGSEVEDIIEKTLKKQRDGSFFKDKMMNMFFGAVGALMTLLLIGQWQSMDRKSTAALDAVEEHRKISEAKFKVFESELVQLKAKVQTNHGDFVGPSLPLSVDEYDNVQEEIQGKIDQEVYRSKDRSAN